MFTNSLGLQFFYYHISILKIPHFKIPYHNIVTQSFKREICYMNACVTISKKEFF